MIGHHYVVNTYLLTPVLALNSKVITVGFKKELSFLTYLDNSWMGTGPENNDQVLKNTIFDRAKLEYNYMS